MFLNIKLESCYKYPFITCSPSCNMIFFWIFPHCSMQLTFSYFNYSVNYITRVFFLFNRFRIPFLCHYKQCYNNLKVYLLDMYIVNFPRYSHIVISKVVVLIYILTVRCEFHTTSSPLKV